MQDRQGDVLYSGVRQNAIENAKPELDDKVMSYLREFINDRYEVHMNKDFHKTPRPWTTNPIFEGVKFTNVRREHDRSTIWLIDNVCTKLDRPLGDRILDCIMFRLFNKWQTLEMIGMPFEWNGDYSNIRTILEDKQNQDPKYVFFTSAFNTGGMKASVGRLTGEQYIPMRPLALMSVMINDGVVDKIMTAKTPKDVFEVLISYTGIGEFLGYQMFVDLTYCPDYKFSENHFTVAGPGCKLGLNQLFVDYDGMTHEEAIFWLRDNWSSVTGELDVGELMLDLPIEDRVMNVMSLENCFCELGKYIKCKIQVEDGIKPRSRVSYVTTEVQPKIEDKPTANLFDLFT